MHEILGLDIFSLVRLFHEEMPFKKFRFSGKEDARPGGEYWDSVGV